MRLAAGACEGLGLHGQHPQVVGESPSALDGIEILGQFRVLGGDPGGVATGLEVVVEAGVATELLILLCIPRVVVAQRNERSGTDRDGVGTESHGLGDVGARTDAAGDDELD